MRRADRLFGIVQLLRGGRLRTALEMAERLEVSTRTIYRDIDALIATGVPIEGERGVGYVIRAPFLLPPLSFTEAELQALLLGARFVQAWGDPELVAAAEEALVKIDSVLPEARRGEVMRQDIDAHAPRLDQGSRSRLTLLRKALRMRRKVQIDYQAEQGLLTCRTVRPLGLDAWGHAWTLTAWCELRDDFRNFRLDRMREASFLPEIFVPEAGKTLHDYLRRLRAEDCPHGTPEEDDLRSGTRPGRRSPDPS